MTDSYLIRVDNRKLVEVNHDATILHGAAEMAAISDPMMNLLPVDVNERFKICQAKIKGLKGTLIIGKVEDFIPLPKDYVEMKNIFMKSDGKIKKL